MQEKITWENVYEDFIFRHPNLAKMCVWWRPQDYLTILLYLSDGMQVVYDYSNKRSIFLKDRWR